MKLTRSLTAKFILVLLLVLAVGQGIGAFIFITYTRSDLLAALHERMQRLTSQTAAVVAEPILNYNFSVIDSYLQEALQDPDILSLRIVDPEGNSLSQANEGQAEGAFTVVGDIRLDETILGRIYVTFAANTIDAWTRHSLMVVPLFQLIMLICVAALVMLLVNVTIKNPVTRINRVLSQVTAGDLAVSMPKFADDDIGSIARGVAFLIERLSGTIARIHSISANVVAANQNQAEMFSRVSRVVKDQESTLDEVTRALKTATESQGKIAGGTEELLTLSNDNASALLEMRSSSEEIAGSAEKLNSNLSNSHASLAQLSGAAQQVAAMAQEITGSVDESSSSIEEIFSSLKEVETIVKQSAQLSEQTSRMISERGMTAVGNTSQSMQSIESFILALRSSIGGMEKRSKDVNKVLAVIKEVTDQLQLLSLNAQIIAAQVGEHGKGFAVVADEMRELSNRTALSTEEIEVIVSGIQTEIAGVVKEAGETVGIVQQGKEVVNHAGEVFEETLSSSRLAAELARNIERASLEQSKGLELIVKAIEGIKQRMEDVSKATVEQEQSTGHLLDNLHPIKEMMGLTFNATREQASSARLIAGNLEAANQKTSEIAASSQEQQRVNAQILQEAVALQSLARETARNVEENAQVLISVGAELEQLNQEISQFNVAVDYG
jgi:methyl-accepting chemotaxis protein